MILKHHIILEVHMRGIILELISIISSHLFVLLYACHGYNNSFNSHVYSFYNAVNKRVILQRKQYCYYDTSLILTLLNVRYIIFELADTTSTGLLFFLFH